MTTFLGCRPVGPSRYGTQALRSGCLPPMGATSYFQCNTGHTLRPLEDGGITVHPETRFRCRCIGVCNPTAKEASAKGSRSQMCANRDITENVCASDTLQRDPPICPGNPSRGSRRSTYIPDFAGLRGVTWRRTGQPIGGSVQRTGPFPRAFRVLRKRDPPKTQHVPPKP